MHGGGSKGHQKRRTAEADKREAVEADYTDYDDTTGMADMFVLAVLRAWHT